MAYKIMLDPGHGGTDPGAVYEGRQEKDDALRLATAVGEILRNNGYDVEFTRTSDVYDTPFEKATKTNNAGADLFVSFHRNSAPTANQYSGVQSLVYDDSGLKSQLARNINANLTKIGFEVKGVVERPNLVVLKRTKMPAVLIEAGFINSDSDNKLFDEKFYEIANAIACAIMENPELIILDEPVNALDEFSIKNIAGIIEEQKNNGALIIVSAHSKELLLSFCDEIFYKDDGRIIKNEKIQQTDNK